MYVLSLVSIACIYCCWLSWTWLWKDVSVIVGWKVLLRFYLYHPSRKNKCCCWFSLSHLVLALDCAYLNYLYYLSLKTLCLTVDFSSWLFHVIHKLHVWSLYMTCFQYAPINPYPCRGSLLGGGDGFVISNWDFQTCIWAMSINIVNVSFIKLWDNLVYLTAG